MTDCKVMPVKYTKDKNGTWLNEVTSKFISPSEQTLCSNIFNCRTLPWRAVSKFVITICFLPMFNAFAKVMKISGEAIKQNFCRNYEKFSLFLLKVSVGYKLDF